MFYEHEIKKNKNLPPLLTKSFYVFLLYFFGQNFKREEQNFVVQNEINNLSFLTGDNKTKMSKVGVLCL